MAAASCRCPEIGSRSWCRGSHGNSDDERARPESRRYATAIGLLLRHCFEVPEDEVEPVGDVSRATTLEERAFRSEVAVRMVHDPNRE